MTSSQAGSTGEEDCALCGEPLRLDDEHRLTLRHLSPDDEPALVALYGRLTRSDLHRRFFTASLPPHRFFDYWSSIGVNGGFGLVAELQGPAGVELIGDAGYALLSDGDGELGITVDPDHRGWLGPWLLDALLAHANERGVPNLQALVLADNAAMMALARKRGFAVLDHPDWSTVRLTMGTAGHTPSWPGGHARPRLLVESERTRWTAEKQAREAGFDVAICSGPCRAHGHCPVLEGEPCPLIEGADAVVIDVSADDPGTVAFIEAERVIHPGIRLIAGFTTDAEGRSRRRSGDEILAELADLAVDDDRSPHRHSREG